MDNAADSSSSLFTSAEEEDASSPSNRLLRLLSPVASCNVDRMSGTDLAYVGDVVYELFVRSRTVWVSGALLEFENYVTNIRTATDNQNLTLSYAPTIATQTYC